VVVNSKGHSIPVKMIAEQHVEEDCGFVPTPKDYLKLLTQNPEKWMLTVGKTSRTVELTVKE
jgi:hypothetical protein